MMNRLLRIGARGGHAAPWSMALALALVIALVGCGQAGDGEAAAGDAAEGLGEPPYQIVTTTGMVGDIVRQVVGDHGEVSALMGEGVDPHLYEPTRSDVIQLQNADVIFYSGLLLEGRMSDTFVRLARAGNPIFAVTELIDPEYLIEVDEFPGERDPHLWMDVHAWSQCAQAVAEQMAELDPDNARHYLDNAASYRQTLEELDAYVQEVVGSIPEDHRVLITAHDAFNYFGRRYGLDVRGVWGISTQSEAGIRDIQRLVSFIVEQQIPAVFAETSVPDRAVRSLIEGANDRDHEVKLGGYLFSDAMGPSGTYEGTYIGMIDHNATTIARALGGEAPEDGWQGELSGFGQ